MSETTIAKGRPKAGRALDELIAREVFGASLEYSVTVKEKVWSVTHESMGAPHRQYAGTVFSFPMGGLEHYDLLPKYSSEEKLALAVLGRVRPAPVRWSIERDSREPKECYCATAVFDGVPPTTAFGSTLAEATCRLALMIARKGGQR